MVNLFAFVEEREPTSLFKEEIDQPYSEESQMKISCAYTHLIG